LKAKVTALGLGSARRADFVLKPGVTASLFEIEVAAGAQRLEIALEHADPKAWVGLYLYQAPHGPDKAFGDPKTFGDATALIYHDPSHATKKYWTLETPPPGKYVVAVDPLQVPASGLEVHYRDVVIHPAFGAMTCEDADSTLAPGASKEAKLSWMITARPAQGRALMAEAALLSPEVGYAKPVGTKGTPEEKSEFVPVPLATQLIPVESAEAQPPPLGW